MVLNTALSQSLPAQSECTGSEINGDRFLGWPAHPVSPKSGSWNYVAGPLGWSTCPLLFLGVGPHPTVEIVAFRNSTFSCLGSAARRNVLFQQYMWTEELLHDLPRSQATPSDLLILNCWLTAVQISWRQIVLLYARHNQEFLRPSKWTMFYR